MAAPSYATDLVSVNADAESTTSWSALGGGGAGLSADPDFAIEGTNSVTKQVSNALKGMVYETGTRTQATNDHIYQWIYATTPGLLDTLALGGMRVSVGTSDTALNEYYIRGAAEYAEGGWICEPVRYDSTVTPSPGRQLGSPGTAPSSFGGQIDTTATVKAVNFSCDICYEGSLVSIVNGDSGDPASYEKLTDYSYDSTRRWGVILPTDSGAALQGKLYWGLTGLTACYARDSGKFISFVDTPHSLTDLTEIRHEHGSSDQEFLSFTFQAAGTNNRGIFTVIDNAPVDYTGSTFNDIDTFVAGGTNTVLDECTFNRTNEVTGAGASFLGASFLTPTVATDSYALLYNEAVDPDGELDGAIFSKGTNSHHAIEFGTSAPTAITLRGIDFSGFSGTGTAAALNFLRTTGSTTVNLVGCTGTITAQVTGSHTVTFVVDPVTTEIHVITTGGADIENARVLIYADTGGDMEADVTVTITSSGTTASVAHTGHGMANGDKVYITGAAEGPYNGVQTISNQTTNAYDYTMIASTSSPATGTIKCAEVIIDEDTTALGIATDTRTFTADQPIRGRSRKSTGSPFYKTSAITGEVSSSTGYAATIQMISDE